jgi:NADPH:quinone reductase-like Zn-dependent oxidoreductase
VRRILIEKPGGFDALRVVESPDPLPAAGEVRLRVEACGVNYADGIIRMGLYESAKRLHGYPITPGFELAGVVDAVGEGVEGWQVGDRAIGVTLFGGYTSAICLPVDRVFATPISMTSEQAAALPTVFLTAWFMAHLQVHPRAGERWLVHSAAGGVGGALLQLARLAGVEVTGVVGASHKIDAAKTLGATHVIDKSAGDWVAAAKAIAPGGFHAVFDANGVSTLQASFDLLAPMGKLLIYGFASMLPKDGRVNWLRLAWDWWRTPRFNPLTMTTSNRSVLAANLSFLSAEAPLLREGMLWLLERFADGRLAPPPVQAFPLDAAAQAQQRIESGQSVGKIVLIP